MSIRILSFVLMVVFSVTGSFAQTYEKDRWMEEESKRYKEIAEDFRKQQIPAFAEFVAAFLPAGKDAWTISISRSGGFFGESEKLFGLINSEGAIACTAADRFLPEDSLTDLSEFIRTNDFKKLRKTFKPAPSFCRDCYATTLTLTHRRKKTKIYQFSWISLPESASEIQQFYEKVQNYTSCQ